MLSRACLAYFQYLQSNYQNFPNNILCIYIYRDLWPGHGGQITTTKQTVLCSICGVFCPLKCFSEMLHPNISLKSSFYKDFLQKIFGTTLSPFHGTLNTFFWWQSLFCQAQPKLKFKLNSTGLKLSLIPQFSNHPTHHIASATDPPRKVSL